MGEKAPATVATWRVGRKVGRTIYAQQGIRPSDDDVLIGVMDTPELAALVVLAVNMLLPHGGGDYDEIDGDRHRHGPWSHTHPGGPHTGDGH